jgi:hypothetical protein
VLGGGKYSARWAYSSNTAQVCKYIPACTRCLTQLKESGPDYNLGFSSNQCTKWETCSDHPLLCTTAPPKFLTEVLVGKEILPLNLTYQMLREAVNAACEILLANRQSNEEAKQYPWVFGLNNDAISSCIEHASNAKLFFVAELHKNEMPCEYNTLSRHKE